MLRRSLLTALATLSLLVPGVASAYVTPEDALQMSPPVSEPVHAAPSTQSRREALDAQSQAKDEWVQRQIEYWYGKSSSSSEDSSEDTSGASHSVAGHTSSAPGGTVTLHLSSADLRLLARLQAAREAQQLHAGAPLDQLDGKGDGKGPLAPSGPAGILTVLAMIGAFTWTMYRSQRLQNRKES